MVGIVERCKSAYWEGGRELLRKAALIGLLGFVLVAPPVSADSIENGTKIFYSIGGSAVMGVVCTAIAVFTSDEDEAEEDSFTRKGWVIGLGGTGNSMPREAGFDITAASEVMAIFTLARSLDDLRERLGRIVVARTFDSEEVTAADVNAQGSMTALLRDALACLDVVRIARAWYAAKKDDPHVVANLPRLVQYREHGLDTHIRVGTPVIA